VAAGGRTGCGGGGLGARGRGEVGGEPRGGVRPGGLGRQKPKKEMNADAHKKVGE